MSSSLIAMQRGVQAIRGAWLRSSRSVIPRFMRTTSTVPTTSTVGTDPDAINRTPHYPNTNTGSAAAAVPVSEDKRLQQQHKQQVKQERDQQQHRPTATPAVNSHGNSNSTPPMGDPPTSLRQHLRPTAAVMGSEGDDGQAQMHAQTMQQQQEWLQRQPTQWHQERMIDSQNQLPRQWKQSARATFQKTSSAGDNVLPSPAQESSAMPISGGGGDSIIGSNMPPISSSNTNTRSTRSTPGAKYDTNSDDGADVVRSGSAQTQAMGTIARAADDRAAAEMRSGSTDSPSRDKSGGRATPRMTDDDADRRSERVHEMRQQTSSSSTAARNKHQQARPTPLSSAMPSATLPSSSPSLSDQQQRAMSNLSGSAALTTSASTEDVAARASNCAPLYETPALAAVNNMTSEFGIGTTMR